MSLFKVDFTTTQSLSSYFKTQLQVAQFFTTNQTLHADKFILQLQEHGGPVTGVEQILNFPVGGFGHFAFDIM